MMAWRWSTPKPQYWSTRIPVGALRGRLRDRMKGGDDDAAEALAWLHGMAGSLNFIEAAWNAPAHVQGAIRRAGSDVLAEWFSE